MAGRTPGPTSIINRRISFPFGDKAVFFNRLRQIAQNYQLYLFILPTVIYFLVFKYGPMYGVQGGPLALNDEYLKLHIFLDRSMIEVYANGLKSLTSRVYPSRPDALGLRLWGNGDVVVKQLDVWEMDSAYNS